MRRGDVYTHCYHGFESTIIDPDRRAIHPSVVEARERGVLFDIGHGMGAFNWTVAEICAALDSWPDAVSTDMHSLTCEGPGYDLPTVMSKLLHVGMPLEEVVRASTVNACGGDRLAGSHRDPGVGREADVAVLALNEVDAELEDCQGQTRRLSGASRRGRLESGEPGRIIEPEQWPNPGNAEKAKAGWPQLLIRDDTPP